MLRLVFIVIIYYTTVLTSTYSQPWNYNFGTSTGSYTTNAISTTFLPVPPSGGTLTRIGSGAGSVNLENQLIPFGSDSYLRSTAASGTSVNKFGVNNYTAGKSFTIKFDVRFGASNGSSTGASSGNWYLFIGDGTMYTDGGTFAGNQVFSGLRFRFGAGGTIFFSIRNRGNWDSTTVSRTYFLQGQTYQVEIYGNNTTSSQTYDYGTLQSIDSNKFDIWIDGVLFANDIPKALIANDANIDSWVFYGESSAGNSANIFTDNFYYQNSLAGTPLPVTMGTFAVNTIKRSALLSWSTLTEINNAGFIIERCLVEGITETGWQKAGFVTGNGNSNSTKDYYFEDKNLNAGKYKYRLKQTDYNGNFEYFTPVNSEFVMIEKPAEFYLSQNYPNPSNPASRIDYQVPFDGFVKITVFDITGKTVSVIKNGFHKADYYTAEFDGSNLSSGVYFYSINGISGEQKFTATKKMLLIK